MKIVSVEPRPVSVRLARTDPEQVWSAEWSVQMPILITTDTEDVGIGDVFITASDQSAYAGYTKTFEGLIKGLDPFEINMIHGVLEKASFTAGRAGVVSSVISGIDAALYDLLAKQLGVPVYRLLGGKSRDSVTAYASYARYRSAEDVAKITGYCIERGFTGIKLHQPASNVLESVKKVRDFGYDLRLMVDMNCTMTLTQALRIIRGLERYEVEWVEEPVWPPENHMAIREVASSTEIPIAAGENEYTLAGFADLVTTGRVRILQPDIAKVGGFTSIRKVAAVAEELGVPLIPHCRPQTLWLTIAETAHFAVTLPEDTMIEVSPTDPEQAPFVQPLVVRNGKLTPPSVPGLGIRTHGWFEAFPPVAATPPRFHEQT